MDDRTEANRRHWDDLAELHPETDFYDVEGVVAGESSLHGIEREELGEVSGKSLLHLQCHIGLDSISLAREGADVTAVDFSPEAIERARGIAEEAGVDVEFVECDLYDVPEVVDREFEVVFTSYGVLGWLPDIEAWADVVADSLAPGGSFYVVDYHPFTNAFAWEDLRPAYPYFGEEALEFDEQGSYADFDAEIDHPRAYEWIHGLGEIVTALIDAGLELEFLHEFPYANFRRFEAMSEDDEGRWWLDGDVQLPQMFSIRATKYSR